MSQNIVAALDENNNYSVAQQNEAIIHEFTAIMNNGNRLGDQVAEMRQTMVAQQQQLQQLTESINCLTRRMWQTELPPPPAAPPAPPTEEPCGSGISRKIELFADPGEYDGSKAKFEEWWAKMKTWLNVNRSNVQWGSYDAVVAVLSRLKGPTAGRLAQTRLNQGT